MYKLLTQKGTMFALLLGILLIAIFFGAVFSGLSSAGYSTSDDLNSIMKNNADADFSFFNVGTYIFLGLIIACMAAWVLFGIAQLISSPKDSLKSIITIVALGVIFFALYSMSVHETTGSTAGILQKFDVGEGASKFISGAIKGTGLLGALAVVSVVFGELRNIFK